MTTTITCTTCSGTGLVSGVVCTTCNGNGTLTVEISGIDPDSITGDSNVDVDPLDYSASLFVPKNDGSSDKTTPGVLLRLGGYCDTEIAADTEDKANVLYPEQYVSSLDDSAKTTAYSPSAGSSTKGGILLSCDGQLLIKACEKTFIRSDDLIKIESGKEIVIRSGRDEDGDSQDITLNSNKGDINITAHTAKKNFFGNEIKKVELNSVSYTIGDTVGITEGTKTFVTFGSENFMCFGSQVLVTCAATLGISIAPIAISISVGLKFKMVNVDFSYTITKFEKQHVFCEQKDTTVADKLLSLESEICSVEKNQVNVVNALLKVQKDEVATLQRQINLNKFNIGVNSSEISLNNATLGYLLL